MRQDAKPPAPKNNPRRATSRGLTVYDKIAAARERREGALAKRSDRKLSSSPDEEKHREVTTAAIVDNAAPALDALSDTTVAEVPVTTGIKSEDATGERRKPGSVRLWTASTIIAAVAILMVAWGSRPAGTGLQDIIPVSAALPNGPNLTTQVQGLPEPGAVESKPVSPSMTMLPPRVEFGAMPDVQIADQPPGAKLAPTLLANESASLRDLRVVLNAPRTVPDRRLTNVVEALQSGGVVPDPRRVNLTISRANVRYFHPEDSAAAELIANAIGADLRDFTDFEPKPEDALIEVWLSGREIGSAQQSSSPLDQLSQELRRLERGLRQALSGN